MTDPTLDADLDDTGAALAALPAIDLPAPAAAALGRTARAVFERETALVARPWARRFDRFWSRGLEPALLAGASGYYFLWALAVTSALRH